MEGRGWGGGFGREGEGEEVIFEDLRIFQGQGKISGWADFDSRKGPRIGLCWRYAGDVLAIVCMVGTLAMVIRWMVMNVPGDLSNMFYAVWFSAFMYIVINAAMHAE